MTENFERKNRIIKKLSIKNIFWALFTFFLIIFLTFWGKTGDEFGYFYIIGVGLFLSFFLAWASTLIIFFFLIK